MPPANIDATVIILDIGRTVAPGKDDKPSESFFHNAHSCVSRIIERKIISRPKDLISIVLLGSKRTKNNMAEVCEGAFMNIEVLTEFEHPNWQALRNLPQKPSKHVGDWFEALLVAADCLKNQLYGVKVTNKKIVLITNFQNPAETTNIDKVITGFQEEKFELTVIGPEIFSENIKLTEDIEAIRHFISETEGIPATFDNAMKYLLFHRKKATFPSAWNVDLAIGPNIKIPVSAYGRIREDKVIGTWIKKVKDPVTGKPSTEEAFKIKKEFFKVVDQTKIATDNIIPGYQYGETIVPFSECDQTMLYNSGSKCLSLYGFTKADNIQWQNLTGNGVSYLFGRKGDKNAERAICSLITCLQEMNLVGIARRVYNNGNAPSMFALVPTVDNNDIICLSMVALIFKEDVKNMAFPSTQMKKYECSDKQVNMFKELIQAMNLTNAYDETYDDKEAFPIAETVNPSVQYVLDCMAFRAMNPNQPLPPPRDDIMELFRTPPLIQKRSKPVLDKLKDLFELKVIEKKIKKMRLNKDDLQNIILQSQIKGEDMMIPDIKLPVSLTENEEVTSIGTVDPITDFEILLKKGKSLNDLKNELTDIIQSLIFLNFDNDYSKAMNTLKVYRDKCLETNPEYYNDWFTEFKKDLLQRRKDVILKLLLDNKLNYISTDENVNSKFTAETINGDEDLYENDTIPNLTAIEIESGDMAYFDEM